MITVATSVAGSFGRKLGKQISSAGRDAAICDIEVDELQGTLVLCREAIERDGKLIGTANMQQ
jgi:hypothetical protein